MPAKGWRMTPEQRKRMSEERQRRYSDPVQRKKLLDHLAHVRADPESRLKRLETIRSPDYRRRLSDAVKNSPTAIAQRARLHSDPMAPKRARASMMANPEWPRMSAERAAKIRKWSASPEGIAHLDKIHHDPEVRKSLMAGFARRSANPEWRAMNKSWLIAQHSNPDFIAAISEGGRRRWSDPAQRRAGLLRLARVQSENPTNPKWIEAMKKVWNDPDVRKKNSDGLRAWARTPEGIAFYKRLHTDPEIIAKKVKCLNPSKEELALAAFLPAGFIHTGQDAARRVLTYWPDYQWPDRKLIVEMDGHFRHWSPANIERGAKRDRALIDAGWRVLHVLAQDMRDPVALRARIAAFVDLPAG